MTESPGQIGPYVVEREIGRGGMGVVYLGRDPELGRSVAIKVLPEAFASDPERLARLDREAKLLASISHPNVATIYGVGADSGRRYLALEHVPGESLAARLARGPVSLGEALDIARQVAAGLEAAHDAGVVHRDLKPGNVLLTPAGEVKVLDFGLAKGGLSEGSSPDLDAAPTATYHLTSPGVVLGTAAYMSPEQARGRPVDRRTDLWALGCILFECLAGRAPFAADTASDTLARILERDPEWDALAAEVSAKVRDLLRRCLEKDPRSRMRDAGDARLELEEAQGLRAAASSPAAPLLARPRRRWRRLALPLALLLGGIALGGALGPWLQRNGAAAGRQLHLTVSIPRDLRVSGFALSPRGDLAVIRASHRADPEATPRLYLRRLASDELVELPGSERASSYRMSPDGRWLYFHLPSPSDVTTVRLMRAPADGSSPPSEMVDWQPGWGDWTVLRGGGVLVVRGGDLLRLSPGRESPGEPQLIDVGAPGRFSFTSAPPLPGDRGVLMNMERWSGRGFQLSTVLIDPDSGKGRILVDEGGNAWATGEHLLFARGDRLLGVPFDADEGTIHGQPAALVGDLRVAEGWEPGWFALSGDGTLAYLAGGVVGNQRRLIALTPGGEATAWNPERRTFTAGLAASPDGRSVAVYVPDAKGKYDIWRVAPTGSPQPLVALPDADAWHPLWSPRGDALVYSRNARQESDGVYLARLAGGEAHRLLLPRRDSLQLVPTSWSPDGSRLLLTQREEGRASVIEIPIGDEVAEGSVAPRLLIPEGFEARLSPDGRWLLFVAEDSGRPEVYLAHYEDGAVGPRQGISQGRASSPQWSPDGRTVYFFDQRRHVLAVPVREGEPVGEPRAVADIEAIRALPLFDVLPDGRLLFVQKGELEDDVDHTELVLGFGRELARRIPNPDHARRCM
ncbi:MAG TPA: protein kinase [Thermoanaerobaculia bacterium]|nr:protein kinase [Thermoanaerobaculia bacterium]